MKVNFFDKKLLKNYFADLSIINLIVSFLLIAVKIPNNNEIRIAIGITLLVFFSIYYIVKWRCANIKKEAILNINNSTIVIKTGDIFEEDTLKVIAFNEYFDTLVDNKIIAENTLNGKFIKEEIDDTDKLDVDIDTNSKLNTKVLEINKNRDLGKKKKYNLGSIYEYKDFLLTSFSKFDKDNRAYLSMNDYIHFLMNFWNEIDMIYAGRSVAIPLLGSGITRFKGYDTILEQELLELMIWSFKVSRIKFAYPSKVSIIIHESKKQKINFYKLNNDI